jgi:hypothetical protein
LDGRDIASERSPGTIWLNSKSANEVARLLPSQERSPAG